MVPDLTPLPPNCHPKVFGEILFGGGGRDADCCNQFIDIQSFRAVLHPYSNKKRSLEKGSFVRIKGLEPPRRKASDPKSDVATNYTISALSHKGRYFFTIHNPGLPFIRLFWLLLCII